LGNFSSYQDILPDPNNKISLSGDSAGTTSGTIGEGKLGPGFATVKFSANQPVMMNRTNSGRVITRSVAAHSWNIDINYNPMTREEFEPIFSFLMSRNGKLNPFFVELPQYLTSRNSGFHTQTSGGTLLTMAESSAIPAGRTYFRTSWGGSASSLPAVGDIFTITDPNNSSHTKVYMTTRVETAGDFNTTLDSNTDPTISPFRVRIHFSPPLVSSVSTTSTLDYVEPRIRVIQKTDVQEYSLGVNGLYKFDLKVEEAAP
tara:strand:+ start:483 stop:1259 length:777 start_codon:yes stop_codon:yes gene_type:complete